MRQLQIFILRLFNPRATHCFFFSRQQFEAHTRQADYLVYDNYFKGKIYSEMRAFKYGYKSIFKDAEFLGIGTYEDVEINLSALSKKHCLIISAKK